MKKHHIILLSLLGILIAPVSVRAARLYFLPISGQVQSGKEFTAELRIDTQKDSINALDVQFSFPEDIVRFESASDASSIINIWVERPHLVEGEHGMVRMSGVAPGGFMGDGVIAQVTFKGVAVGNARFAVAPESKVVLDGPDGQVAFVISHDVQVRVTEGSLSEVTESPRPADTKYVPVVVAQLAKTEIAYDDKWFISFTAQDKDFGIKEYQVRERFLGFLGGEWKKTNSPYVIEHQNLLSVIEVQAVTNGETSGQTRVIPNRLKLLYGVLIASLASFMLLLGVKKIARGLPRVT